MYIFVCATWNIKIKFKKKYLIKNKKISLLSILLIIFKISTYNILQH